jgi:hypothetical protein
LQKNEFKLKLAFLQYCAYNKSMFIKTLSTPLTVALLLVTTILACGCTIPSSTGLRELCWLTRLQHPLPGGIGERKFREIAKNLRGEEIYPEDIQASQPI